MSVESIGMIIRRERIRQGMTQEQLAEKADISLNFMSLIENGRNMSAQTLINIADALGLSIDNLVNYSSIEEEDRIANQIMYDLSTLNNDEKLFILSIIKQYKSLDKRN